MATHSALRTARRTTRHIALLLVLLAAMLKAMPATAAPSVWSVKIARAQMFGCQRGLGICIDLFGPTASTRVSFEVERRGVTNDMAGSVGRLVFLEPLAEKGDTFHIDEEIVLDREHSLGLGYQRVTLLKGAYPIVSSADGTREVLIALRTIGITVTLDIGRKSMGCTGAGVCKVSVGFDLGRAATAGGSAVLEGDRLVVDLFAPNLPDTTRTLTIDEDIVLDEATSLELGAKELTIRKGQIEVKWDVKEAKGARTARVELPVKRFGIVVNVRVGKPSMRCTGFGICEITIGFDFARSSREVPAVASIDGDVMTLDFLGRTPETGDVLEIEEDLTLDGRTAGDIAIRHVTIMKGRYAVDRSENEFGQVEIPVQRIDIDIEIVFGRKHCERGFGICKVLVDFNYFDDANDRVGRASGVWIGRHLMSVTFAVRKQFAGDTLHVDNDVLLEGMTRPVAGAGRIWIKRGAYPVDYSTNPAGVVTLVTETEETGTVGIDRSARRTPEIR